MFELVKKSIRAYYELQLKVLYWAKTKKFENAHEIMRETLRSYIKLNEINEECTSIDSNYNADDVFSYIDDLVDSEEFKQWYESLLKE